MKNYLQRRFLYQQAINRTINFNINLLISKFNVETNLLILFKKIIGFSNSFWKTFNNNRVFKSGWIMGDLTIKIHKSHKLTLWSRNEDQFNYGQEILLRIYKFWCMMMIMGEGCNLELFWSCIKIYARLYIKPILD